MLLLLALAPLLLQLAHNRASTTGRERENVRWACTRGELRHTIVRQLQGGSAKTCDGQAPA